MPYVVIDDLPEPVKHALPKHAQEIYLKAFNNAWVSHAGDDDLEAVAAKIAWSAVKRQYEKGSGKVWVKKQ
jgi:cation transport regulator